MGDVVQAAPISMNDAVTGSGSAGIEP